MGASGSSYSRTSISSIDKMGENRYTSKCSSPYTFPMSLQWRAETRVAVPVSKGETETEGSYVACLHHKQGQLQIFPFRCIFFHTPPALWSIIVECLLDNDLVYHHFPVTNYIFLYLAKSAQLRRKRPEDSEHRLPFVRIRRSSREF